MTDFFLIIVVNVFFLYLAIGYFRLLWNRQAERRILLVGAAVFFCGVLNICTGLVGDGQGIRSRLAFCVIVVLMIGGEIIYYLISYSLERQRELRERLMQQQMDGMKMQYQFIEAQQAETRRQRHELKNLYLAIEAMAKKQDYQGIEELVRRQGDCLQQKQGQAATGNQVVDAVINYRMERPEAERIEFELKLNIPTTLQVPDVVLSGVLGNLLDNAVEASGYLPMEERKINISIYVDRKNLFMEITNNYDGTIAADSRGRLTTRKADKKGHGYGLSVVRDMLKPEDGDLQLRWSDRQFQARVVFYHAM